MTGGAGELNQGALQPRLVGLAPVDLEAVPTAVTPHRGGMSFERLAFAAAGTHGVADAPARRQPLGIVRARHDRPTARRGLDDLEERRRHLQPLPAHLEDDLQWAELPDAVPGAPAQPYVQVRLQASPLHAGHGDDLGQSNDIYR